MPEPEPKGFDLTVSTRASVGEPDSWDITITKKWVSAGTPVELAVLSNELQAVILYLEQAAGKKFPFLIEPPAPATPSLPS